MTDTRHRGDLALDAGTVDHEERLDQVAGGEMVFPNETAEGLGAAASSGTGTGTSGPEKL